MRTRWVLLLTTALSLVASAARADDPPAKPPPLRTESAVIPLVGGDSDIGFGGGALGGVAHFDPEYTPYQWRMEAAGIATFKPPTADHSWRMPFLDLYTLFTFPELIGHKIRLTVRPSFTWEQTQKYYGLGNASHVDGSLESLRYEYERVHPTLQARLRIPMIDDKLYVETGPEYTQNWLDVPPGTKLADDAANGSPYVRDTLRGLGTHGVLLFNWALVADTRDSELSATRGVYHQLELRASPGGTSWLPYRYGQGDLTARFYAPLVPDRRLTLAVRGVFDVLVGDAPFYELARFEETFAIGGANGVRGVPAQRYYGKVKLFGNVELRSEIVRFHMFGKENALGLVGFFDAGRLWTDFESHPELDGTDVGLKYGAGGGVRLRAGDTLVVRFDVAYSPDARPIGAYFGAGEMF